MCEYRKATEKDYEAISSLVKSKEEMFHMYPTGSYPFTVAQLRKLSTERMELTVVVNEHGIIGFANLYNYKAKEYAFIGNIIIDEKHRGRGLGKKLVSYMLRQTFLKYGLLRKLSTERMELTVVVNEHGIIGFANLYNYKAKEYAFIGNIIIDEKHRGRGLGKKLVSYMLRQTFLKYGLPEVRISVFSENVPALLLYSELGFTPYAVEKRNNHESRRVALIHMKIENNV